MIKEEIILTALRQIIDPDLRKDIVTLGFIKNLSINDHNVSFQIELTTPACPIKNYFYEQAHAIVSEIPSVKNVEITMTSKKQPNQKPQKNLRKVNSIIAVASCKGGVGKSTVAATIAYSLAQRGHKIGLLDADIFGPSVPTLFNVQNKKIQQQDDGKIIPLEHENLKMVSFGNIIGDAPAVLRGPMVSRYISTLLLETAWGELDYLFIDMPPGTGDVQLTIAQTIPIDGAIVVTTPSTLSLVDVARGLLMFESVDIPVLSVINNMSYFVCDSCDKEHYIFGKTDIQNRFGIESVLELPILKAYSLKDLADSQIGKKITNHIIREIGKLELSDKAIPSIEFSKSEINISWSDGKKLKLDNRKLRGECRCAHCRDEMSGKKLIDEQKIPEDIHATKITPLGNYAISISWSDGHSTGIYPYQLLKTLS